MSSGCAVCVRACLQREPSEARHDPQALVAIGTFLTSALPASAQQDYGPWRMHEWGWGGMWFGPLLMLAVIVLFVALVVLLVRWLGGQRGLPSAATRTRSRGA